MKKHKKPSSEIQEYIYDDHKTQSIYLNVMYTYKHRYDIIDNYTNTKLKSDETC